MKLTFVGTRGYIDARTYRHAMHTALLIEFRRRRVLIDAGEDWLGKVEPLKPRAIVLTHAHPDHAWGLKDGAPCPVYTTPLTWELLADYPLQKGGVLEPRTPAIVEGIQFEAFPLWHSITSPAVGYRITTPASTIFYAPDVAYIENRNEALRSCSLYIGDGATVTQSFVRKQGDKFIGHAPARTQVTWCQKEGVPRMIVTHCGTEIVTGDESAIEAQLQEIGRKKGVDVQLAYDGLQITLPAAS